MARRSPKIGYTKSKPPKIRVAGKFVRFYGDIGEIKAELVVLANALAAPFSNELKQENPAKLVETRMKNSILSVQNSQSGRIKEVLKAIDLHDSKTYAMLPSKAKLKITGSKANRHFIRIANIKELTEKTRISVLDRKYREYHYAPFTGQLYIPKRLGQPSKRLSKNALWRLLEFPTKLVYPIRPRSSSKPLYYTQAKDGYSKWHVSTTSVIWRSKSKSPASLAYFMLNSARQVYDSDKSLIKQYIVSSLQRVIQTKTRFR